MLKHLYILLFTLLSFVPVSGQGWERIYGGSGQDVAKALAATPDGGYILTGYYNGNIGMYLIKVDVDGKLQWSKVFSGASPSSRMEGFGVVVTPDNGYVVAGYIDQDGNGPLKRDIYLVKTDAFGEKLWEKTYGSTLDDEARALAIQPDGGFVLTGFQTVSGGDENVFILKTDPQGNTLWFNKYGAQAYRKKGFALALGANGDVVVVGEQKNTIFSPNKDIYALKVGTSGNLIKEQIYTVTDSLGITGDDEARSIVATGDGNFVLAGFSNIGQGGVGTLIKIDGALNATPIWQKLLPNYDFYGVNKETATGNLLVTGVKTANGLARLNIMKMSPTGQFIWEANVGQSGVSFGNAILPTRGGAIAAGFIERFISPTGESYAFLVRTDSEGRVLTSYIQANIFRDFNNNCQPDPDEPGLKNWIVKVESEYNTLYTVANNNGDLRVAVDTGVFKLVLFPPNSYWKSCDSIVQVTVPNFYDTVFVAVPVRAIFDCPRNEVDIATPILRRCSDNLYTVRYCNSGTIPSLDTKVQVVLDPMMSFVSSSIPVSINGDTLTFNVGTVPNGDCTDFAVTVFLDCDSTIAGQTHCVSAYISPNDFCDISAIWDSAIIAARAYCENDSVKMELQNIGLGNMQTPLGYIITEEVIMLTAPNDPNYRFQLDAGQDSVVWSHPANGSTFRIIAAQSPGYPGAGYPTAAVEGCVSDTSTNEISYGFYTMFPEDDADAFKETDCQESQETDYNPVHLKRGHPKGYDVAHHYVSPETDLDFLIQFRNTSADTVRQVIIRDTLSAALDPSTVYPGASSHPYQFEMYGGGIVQFTLENANLLPDGGASEGFVKFRVAQKTNLPCETIIFNSAAIYFDFSAPTMSNTTFHTVCPFDSFIVITNTRQVYVSGATVNTYPNPARDVVNFDVKGVEAQQFTLQLYDIQGRFIANLFFDHPTFQLFRRQLPTGTLMYHLAADGKPVASGKIIVR